MNRRDFLAVSGATLAAPLVLSLESCGGLNVTLDAITIAIDAILPFIPNIPAAALPIIEKYLTQLTTAVEGAATELSSSDSALVKTEKIAALFGSIILPDLTSLGVPANVINLINVVAKAVTDFLAAIGIGQTPAAIQAHDKIMNNAASKTPMISTSQADKIIARAKTTAAKLK
jgi:hypothetical protein